MCAQVSEDILREIIENMLCSKCAAVLNSILRPILTQPVDPTPDVPFRYLPEDFGTHTSHDNIFEVSDVHMKITGSEPENAFLYVELIIKGYELSPLELHMPLPTCKSRYIINKNVVSLTPDGILPVLRDFFQEFADILHFEDNVNF